MNESRLTDDTPPDKSPSASRFDATRIAGPIVLVLAVVFVTIMLFSVPSTPPPSDATAALGGLADPDLVYDPVVAGEQVPEGYRALLDREDILPIYEPTFVAASDAPWNDSSLVIGLAISGEAKAYHVGHLNRREMVVDSLAGIPVLVTW